MPQIPKYSLKPINLGKESINQRIALLRKERGLSQAELARIIGITRNLVSAYESGRVRIFDEMIARFALALKITSDEILGLKKGDYTNPLPSLRVMRRMKELDQLTEQKKKAVLKTIDDLIRANS